MRKIAIINQKGGSGKTTTVVNVGSAIAEAGHRTLLIDLDPQAHTTIHLGFEPFSLEKSVYDVLINEIPVDDVLIQTRIKNLSLMPAKIELASAEIEMVNTIGREIVLREALKKSKNNFDYILIDCPPSLGLLTLNALTAVDEVYIPLQTEFLALQGISKLLETIEIVRKRLNHNIKLTGIIGTRFDARKRLNREVVDRIKEYFGDRFFRTLIRENISLAEAPGFGKTIYEYKPDSYGSRDYFALSKDVSKRNKKTL